MAHYPLQVELERWRDRYDAAQGEVQACHESLPPLVKRCREQGMTWERIGQASGYSAAQVCRVYQAAYPDQAPAAEQAPAPIAA